MREGSKIAADGSISCTARGGSLTTNRGSAFHETNRSRSQLKSRDSLRFADLSRAIFGQLETLCAIAQDNSLARETSYLVITNILREIKIFTYNIFLFSHSPSLTPIPVVTAEYFHQRPQTINQRSSPSTLDHRGEIHPTPSYLEDSIFPVSTISHNSP